LPGKDAVVTFSSDSFLKSEYLNYSDTIYALVDVMSLSTEVRIGKRRTMVIPKAVAEALGIDEGSMLRLEVRDGRIILEPIPDAIQLSLRGEKIGKVSLKELEAESVEKQRKYISEA